MPKHDLFDVLQDPYPALTEAQIRVVERELGLQFPDDYVRFLLRTNGGYCHHTVEYLTDAPLPWGWSDGRVEISQFFAITDDPDEYNDIRSQSPLDKLMDAPIPSHLVPFADTPSPDFFCFVGKGPDFGKVYFWSKDDGVARLVAPNFTEFLEGITLPEDRTWNLHDSEADSIPVFRAIRYGDVDAVRDYLDAGGDVNLATGKGTTLLMCAAHARWPKLFELILSRNPDWRLRNPVGWDALRYAAAAQSLAEVRLLLAAGADANTRDNKGQGPLDMLVEDRLYDLLEAHGAKRNARNNEDNERPK